jgi:uncharacterized membrane protein
MMKHLAPQPLKTLLLLLPVGLLCTAPAFACSLVNEEASMANAVAVSGTYWIVSILLGGVIIALEVYRKRWWSWPILVLTMGLVIFHPARTVPSLYYPDCTFINVHVSQIVIAVLLATLSYQIVRVLLARRRSHAGG